MHWPTQSSKSVAHVGPPQPSRQTHENEPGRLIHWRAFTHGPIIGTVDDCEEPFLSDDARAAINADDEVLEPAAKAAATAAAVEVLRVEDVIELVDCRAGGG